MNTILDALNRRYATKKFDTSKKLTSEQLEQIMEILRLTPSSYGLQPRKFLIVENMDVRKKLQEKSYNQSQITECSHLIVFTTPAPIDTGLADFHISNIAKTTHTPIEKLDGFKNMITGFIQSANEQGTLLPRAKNQAYIALGNLLTSLATLEIDACPMEGFDANGYDEILGLKERGLKTVVVCPIGFRSAEDASANNPKVRFSKNDLFEII